MSSWAANVFAWLRRPFVREQWVRPGNAITRRVEADAARLTWSEPPPPPEHARPTETTEAVPSRRRRWRRRRDAA